MYKDTLLRLGDVADLSTTQKETQGVSQNEKTNKHVQVERTGQNSSKRTKQIKDRQFMILLICGI